MGPEFIGGLLGFVGGIISGVIAAYATIHVDRFRNANLENDELRKRKVEIIYRLLGSRYVLSEGYEASSDEVRVFNTALALFTVYFADNKEIMRRYDAYLASPKDTDKLIELLREAGKSAGLDLFDSNIKRVLTVRAKRPE
jgi:hypothetical protein